MENENLRRTLGDYSKPSYEGYRNTIEIPDGNNVVPLRPDTIRLVQNGCSFHGLRSEDPNQHLKDFLKLVDSLDRNGRTSKLHNDILMFQQHQGKSLFEAWTRFKDLLQKVPHHGIDLWLQEEEWYDLIFLKRSSNYETANMEQVLEAMECQVDSLIKEAILLAGKSANLCGISSNEFMQLSLKVMEKLMDKIRIKENKKIQKITKSLDTEELGSSSNTKSLGSLVVETLLSYLKFGSPKSLCVKYVHIIFPISPLVRESTFGFKPSTKNKRNVKSRHDAKNLSPQSYPQVLPSFKVYTPPVTYPEEVEETLGTRMKVEPWDQTKL
ncbi:hypothetical protein Tco_0740519 [Tanacetum coccineum]